MSGTTADLPSADAAHPSPPAHTLTPAPSPWPQRSSNPASPALFPQPGQASQQQDAPRPPLAYSGPAPWAASAPPAPPQARAPRQPPTPRQSKDLAPERPSLPPAHT